MNGYFAIFAALLLTACASDYARFYQPVPDTSRIDLSAPPPTPSVRTSTGDQTADRLAMFTEGYGPIGFATFNGPARGLGGAIEQGKKVGVTFIVASRQYTNTISGALPLTLPTTQTTYVNGTYNAGAPGVSGRETTYGTSTTYMPYNIPRFAQQAVFYAPLKHTGLGFIARPLTMPKTQELGSVKGLFLQAIRRGSPVYQADILPGDVLRSINGSVTNDVAAGRELLRIDAVNHIVLTRRGATIEKDVMVPAAW